MLLSSLSSRLLFCPAISASPLSTLIRRCQRKTQSYQRAFMMWGGHWQCLSEELRPVIILFRHERKPGGGNEDQEGPWKKGEYEGWIKWGAHNSLNDTSQGALVKTMDPSPRGGVWWRQALFPASALPSVSSRRRVSHICTWRFRGSLVPNDGIDVVKSIQQTND